MSERVAVMPDAQSVAAEARDVMAKAATHAIAARGVFHWALSGGSTPKAAYALIAKLPPGAVDWARVQVWFGDERCVPPDHAESNYRMARDIMLSCVPVPPANVHRIEVERGAPVAAAALDVALRDAFPDDEPTFDLAFLGLGSDGHTASLFSPEDLPADPGRMAIAVVAPEQYSVRERVSVTHHVLARARSAVFLVSGHEKTDMLARVLEGEAPADRQLPASIVAASCHTRWIVDRAARGE